MVLEGPLHYMLVGTIAKRCISAELAIAELIVATLSHVEVNRAAPSHNPLALTIAEGTNLRMTTATPFVHLSSMEEDVCWVYTRVGWHAWWSVSALLVWARLLEMNHLLLREIRHIVHRHPISWSWWLHHNWRRSHDITLVSFHLATGWPNIW